MYPKYHMSKQPPKGSFLSLPVKQKRKSDFYFCNLQKPAIISNNLKHRKFRKIKQKKSQLTKVKTGKSK